LTLATLSPAFTGSKMRHMMDFVSTIGHQTADSIKKDIVGGGESIFEFKDFASKFTIDIIASCAFGIEINSFKNPTNDFFRIAKKVTNFTSFKTGLKFAGYLAFPQLMKALKINLLDKESCDFFEEAIYDTMKTREKQGIIRNDMIQLMLQAKAGNLSHNNNLEEKSSDGFATVEESHLGKAEVKRKWDDADLAAQCFIFFLAGFDTVRSLTFLNQSRYLEMI
jgi:cytochrome P450 family 9